jgi:hypothetical protein
MLNRIWKRSKIRIANSEKKNELEKWQKRINETHD